LTPLYIRQVVARAQRVTDLERAQGRVIPATIVVPDIPALVEQVSKVIVPMHHEVIPRDRGTGAGPGISDHESDEPRVVFEEFQLRGVRPDDDVNVRVIGEEDGDVAGDAIRRLEPILEGLHLEPSFAARVIVAGRRMQEQREAAQPFDRATEADAAIEALARGSRPAVRADAEEAAARRRATREDEATSWQRDLHHLSRWWARFGDTPVQHFTAAVNAAGRIPAQGRGHASPEELATAYRWAAEYILAYAQRRGIRPPVLRRDWREEQYA